LIYRAPADLNWCPQCTTTRAQMQVIDGRCWRCSTPVENRPLTQWFVRLSAYSHILYETLAPLQGWSPRILNVLKGFIGRCEGVEIHFRVGGCPERSLTAFAPDQSILDGAAYLAARAANPLIRELIVASWGEQAARDFSRNAASLRSGARRRREVASD